MISLNDIKISFSAFTLALSLYGRLQICIVTNQFPFFSIVCEPMLGASFNETHLCAVYFSGITICINSNSYSSHVCHSNFSQKIVCPNNHLRIAVSANLAMPLDITTQPTNTKCLVTEGEKIAAKE